MGRRKMKRSRRKMKIREKRRQIRMGKGGR